MSRTSKLNNATLEQAAEWYAVLRDGHASDDEVDAWQAWLARADSHRIAWQYVEQISQQFNPLQNTHDPVSTVASVQIANKRLQNRRMVLTSLIAMAGAGFAGWLGWRYTPVSSSLIALRSDYHTPVGQQRELTLLDGSQLWLNTASAINTDFTRRLRRITLLAGEVYIETASDPARSLVVDTVQGRLRALGTRFNVLETKDQIELSVFEGAVEIQTAVSGHTLIVKAGEQVQFSAQRIGQIEPANPTREKWRRGIFVADDTSLRDLVDELRRYHSGHIGLAEGIGHLRIYGNFPIQNADRVLTMLTTALPIQVNQTLPWWISIEPKAD